MPIMTDTQKATLAARLAQPDCASLSAQAACDLLNTQSLAPNPSPQPQIPNPATPDPFALIALVSAESLAKLEGAGLIIRIEDVLHTGDHVALTNWLRYAGQTGKVTAAELAAVEAAIAASPATAPDPAWPATVAAPSWANTWAPGVEFVQPGGHSVADHLTVAMVAEARS